MKKLPLNKDAFAYWGQNAKALLLQYELRHLNVPKNNSRQSIHFAVLSVSGYRQYQCCGYGTLKLRFILG